jgi:hypothetical protein
MLFLYYRGFFKMSNFAEGCPKNGAVREVLPRTAPVRFFCEKPLLPAQELLYLLL